MQPRWSPAGARIAYWGLRGSSGQRDLWKIPADAKGEPEAVSVTEDRAMDWNPVWSPDGRKLYTANGVSNDVSVIDTGTNKVIATIKAGDGPWGIAL